MAPSCRRIMGRMFSAVCISAVAARALATKPDLPIVDLGYERHQAISFNENTGIYNFSNIRYAQPPVGALRFSAPQPPTGRLPDVQVGEQGRICPQAAPEWMLISSQFLEASAEGRASSFNMTEAEEIAAGQLAESGLPAPHADGNPYITEDCLFLDVVIPDSVFNARKSPGSLFPAKGAPVIVWINGGAYNWGNKVYETSGDPSGLIGRSQKNGGDGIVYVAVGYRLGALGWLAGSTLQNEGGSSNAGLLDQRLALEWVQENIRLFGGDPNQVTVMGQSAGAGSIMHHITSYGGWKPVPFQKALIMSPGWVPVTSDQQQLEAADVFLDHLNVTTIEEAQNASSEAVILANARAVGSADWSSFRYGPVTDGSYVSDYASVSLSCGDFNDDVSIMTGHVSDESSAFTRPDIRANEQLTELLYTLFPTAEKSAIDYITSTLYKEPGYNRTKEILSDIGFTCNIDYLRKAFGGQTYNYKFRVPPATHGSDLAYAFYSGPDPGDIDGGIYDSPLGPVHVKLAPVFQDYIINFVKNGDPNGPGLPVFPRADEDTTMLTFDVGGVEVEPDDTDNERCNWLQSVPYG